MIQKNKEFEFCFEQAVCFPKMLAEVNSTIYMKMTHKNSKKIQSGKKNATKYF